MQKALLYKIIALWSSFILLHTEVVFAEDFALTLPSDLRQKIVSHEGFYITDQETVGIKDNTYHAMGGVGKLLLTLVTLRLAGDGILTLDEAVAKTPNTLLDDQPFKVAITPRHLLTETAGFAVPPVIYSAANLKSYASEVRSAGKMAHHDPVGWAILIRLLEQKTGKPILKIIDDTLLLPLGLPITSLKVIDAKNPLLFLRGLKGTEQLLASLTRIIATNRSPYNTAPFLDSTLYQQLTGTLSWRMHPMGPSRTLGLGLHTTSHQHWFELFRTPYGNTSIMVFPAENIGFAYFGTDPEGFRADVIQFANSKLAPNPTSEASDTNALTSKTRINGLYTITEAPAEWLQTRLHQIRYGTIRLADSKDGTTLIVSKENTEEVPAPRVFRKVAPLYYVDAKGNTISFSPYKQGGYMMLDDHLYRFVGLIGDKRLVLDLVVPFFLLLLSSGIYIFRKRHTAWRRMGLTGLLGTLLITFGVAAEYYLWPKVVFLWDMPALVTLWRILLNAGIALTLSLPLFTLSFARKQKMPTGPFSILLVPLHLCLVSVAALGLFIILVAWGVAGNF